MDAGCRFTPILLLRLQKILFSFQPYFIGFETFLTGTIESLSLSVGCRLSLSFESSNFFFRKELYGTVMFCSVLVSEVSWRFQVSVRFLGLGCKFSKINDLLLSLV